MKYKADKGFIVLTNDERVLAKCKKKRYKDVFLIDPSLYEKENISCLKDKGVALFLVSDAWDNISSIEPKLKKLGVKKTEVYTNCNYSPEVSPEEFIEKGILSYKSLEERLDHHGMILHTDYSGRCGHCHRKMDEEDAFCKLCGTRRGEGKFEPYTNEIPLDNDGMFHSVTHTCSCGYSWREEYLGSWGLEKRFCPKCGKRILKKNITGKFPVQNNKPVSLVISWRELECPEEIAVLLENAGAGTVNSFYGGDCSADNVRRILNGDEKLYNAFIKFIGDFGYLLYTVMC